VRSARHNESPSIDSLVANRGINSAAANLKSRLSIREVLAVRQFSKLVLTFITLVKMIMFKNVTMICLLLAEYDGTYEVPPKKRGERHA
jgi:hypothetical protein